MTRRRLPMADDIETDDIETDDIETDDIETAERPFLRGAEVWALAPGGGELMLVSSAYGDTGDFGSISRETRFGYGVGLPGSVWASRSPIVMPTDDPAFVRTSAGASGIACAVGLPVFNGDFLAGVVVFLCGGDELAGAIEVWSGTDELRLADGYYGSLGSFEDEARSMRFARGSGLPGKTWASGMPQLLDDLGDAERFLRPEAAVDAGMRIGVGLPIAGGDATTVMTFLSALDTPLARWIEIWVPDDDGCLRFAEGYSNEGVDLSERYADAAVLPHHGPLGQVLVNGVPLVTDYAGLDGSTWMIVLPVLADGHRRAVVTLVT